MDTRSKNAKLLKGETGDWEVVIGMEVHAHVIAQAKLFSGASAAFGGEPNSHVSLVDAAMPGMLPVINEECVRQAIRTGLGLKAKINLRSVFDRKNYFYPDLPPGYQISQYKSPIVGEGEVLVDMPDGETVRIGIERLHLEQDAGKSIHDRDPSQSLVDLNRAGVALMEIVSKPDLRSADEAKAYVGKLRSIMRYLGTCDGNMEEGSLRADVNVSVRRPGEPLGTRTETKNVNSIRFIGQAIDFEARRQIAIIEDGGTIEQETRLFDPGKGETRSMRSKEEAHDYRYLPDPDLLPLEFSQDYVDALKAHLPELPDARKARFTRDYKLSASDAERLTRYRGWADYFEEVAKGRDAKAAANWIINEMLAMENQEDPDDPKGFVTAPQLGEILDLITEGTISGKSAKELLVMVWHNAGDPRELVEAHGMRQINDTGAIEKIVDDIIANNADKVADAKANPKAVGWFVGQIMKASGGKANPQTTNELVKRKIFEDRPRTRQEPLQPGEELFDFYDESGRNGYEEFRALLNLWLSEVEEAHQAEIISRIRYGGNSAFRSAVIELLVHALLKRLDYKVVVHPEVPNSSKRPDFAATDKEGHVVCYIEVTTINRADKDDGHANREAVIYNAINKANLPAGCLLGYNLLKADKSSPPTRQLVNSIERWAEENADKARTEIVVERFTAGDWEFEIELYSGGDAGSGNAAIGAAAMAGGKITPATDVRAALQRKSRSYGKLDAPYMIVVADTKNQMFHKNAVTDAVVEAVYGDETVVISAGGEATLAHASNGFWFGGDGYRNQHVSAMLLMPDAGIWKLREERWQPVLVANLRANFLIPEPIKGLARLEAEQTKYVKREGKSVADVLALPTPWPPAD